MKRFVIAAILAAAFAGGAYAQQDDRQLFRLAEQRLQTGDYVLAVRSYEQLVQTFPGSPYVPDAQARLGIALFNSGQAERAIPQLRKVEARFRSSAYLPVVPLWLGFSLFEIGDFPAAEQELQRYLSAFPWTGESTASPDQITLQIQAYRILARAKYLAGDRSGAIQTLEALLAPGPRVPSAILSSHSDLVAELAGWYLQERRYEELETFILAVPQEQFTESDQRLFRFSLGEAAFSKEEVDAAKAFYEGLRGTTDRFTGIAYQRLFQIAELAEDEEEQSRIIRLAETDLSGNPEILVPFWLRVGQTAYENGEPQLAELYFLKIWEQRRNGDIPFETVLFLSQIEVDRSDLQRAREYLLAYLALFPETNERIPVKAADLSIRVGEPERALNLLLPITDLAQVQSAAIAEEIFAHGMYLRISALYQLGRYDEAYSLIQALLGQSREGGYTAEYLEYRGRIEMRRNDLEAATGSFRQYLVLRPANASIASAYLRAVLSQRNYTAASAEGKRLLELQTNIAGLLAGYERGVVELVYQTGLASLHLGQMAEAEQYFAMLPEGGGPQWYLRLYPSLLYYRGWAAYQRQDDRAAIRHFQAMLEVNTAHPQAQEAAYLSGWASFRLQDYAAAAGFFQGTALWEPDLGLADAARFLLAKTFRAQRNVNAALSLLQEIWEGDPSNPYRDDAQYERGQILADQGRFTEAAQAYFDLADSLRSSEFAPLALYRRGEALLAAAQYAAARQAFQLFRDRHPTHAWIDGALFAMGEASVGLGEAGAATLFWQRLANDYRQSGYRFEALKRTGEIFEQQGERSRALTVYSELTARYPAESQAEGLNQKVDQLALVLTGLGEREAALWVEIENNRGSATAQGRSAILNLGQVLILDQTGASVNRGNLIPLLSETAALAAVAPEQAARAAYLLGEWNMLISNPDQAAVYFLQAAETGPQTDTQVPVYYYRSIEVLRSRNRLEDARSVLSAMQGKFPRHELTARAQSLLQ